MGSSQPKSILGAAITGDTEFLKAAYEDNMMDLRSYFYGRKNTNKCNNLLHIAVENTRYKFLSDALNKLSIDQSLVVDLICQKETLNGRNSLHIAASKGNIYIVKLLVNAYAKAVASLGNNYQGIPPWLKKDSYNLTPLRRSFFTEKNTNEVIARCLVSWDQSWLRTMGKDRYPMDQCSTFTLDGQQTSIVFNGMEIGCSMLVEQILTSDLPYRINGNKSRETPLHYASNCNEKVSRLLLERHPELIDEVSVEGETVLRKAIKDGATWLVKLMLIEEESDKCNIGYTPPPWIKACRRLIWDQNNETGDTPLHIAARKGNIDIVRFVIQGYNSAIQDEGTEWDGEDAEPGYNDLLGRNPLYIKNFDRQIPLVVALKNKHDDCGIMLSKETFPLTANQVANGLHWEALFAAENNGCRRSVKTILAIIVDPGSSKSVISFNGRVILEPGVIKIFSYLFDKYGETSGWLNSEEMEKLSEVLSEFLKEEAKDVKTLLKEAAERGEDWLVRLFLDSDRDLIMESAPAWQAACEKGHVSTLFTFVDKYGRQEFVNFCQVNKQTPLHHIKLETYGQYIELLEMPVMDKLKNEIDNDGATPLHLAIQRDDLELTKALLDIGEIYFLIKDQHGATALDLFENRCKFSKGWHEEYMDLLKMRGLEELKNELDDDGATPLHRAIQRDDLELTRALLEIKGIDVSLKNKNGTTALDLLENRCKFSKNWGKMCREIKQESTVEKLKYLFRKISFEGMQNTISLVAALVATITFAAGITIPGGVNSQDGTAVLSTKAAFLVFSISNTTAMCSSIMVLFLLLGPMMWDPQPPIFYVDLSLFLLLLSLGGTILAFMTGVYATMVPKVKWNAIFIMVLCSLTMFAACIVLLLTYSSQFKNQVHKASNWVEKVWKPKPPRNPSLPVQLQSLNSNASRQSVASTNTAWTQASDIQLTANALPGNPQLGSSNTLVTQASVVSELDLRQTQSTTWETGQFSGTSPIV